MTSPHDRAVELMVAQLELTTYRIARDMADRLDADHLLGAEPTLTRQLEQARQINGDLAEQVGRVRTRLRAHLDDPDVVTATARTAMPWHDDLVRDLMRIVDGNGG